MGQQSFNRQFSESKATIACIVVSHNKPDYLKEAIDSILNQRFENWEAVIIDSGILYDKGYFNYIDDARIKVIRSAETEELRKTKSMAPWCFNQCLRNNWVNANLITYLCDDDIWYDNAFETFTEFYKNTAAEAMYASQDVAIHVNGYKCVVGERRATVPMGAKCGRSMCCVIDYAQFCHTKTILKKIKSNEYWPEDRTFEKYADGVFMDKIGEIVEVLPIDIKVSQNRRTPISTYIPSNK